MLLTRDKNIPGALGKELGVMRCIGGCSLPMWGWGHLQDRIDRIKVGV